MADFWGTTPATEPQPQQPARAVCRHFLSSTGCTRPDCSFLHTAAGAPDAPVCTFWLKGACRKGSACPFRHSAEPAPSLSSKAAPVSLFSFLPSSVVAQPAAGEEVEDGAAAAAAADSEGLLPVEDWLLSTSLQLERLNCGASAASEDFPALPSAAGPSAAAAAVQPPKAASSSLASKLALAALVRAYPGVPEEELRHCLGAASGHLTQACALLRSRNPGVAPLEGALAPVRVAAAGGSSAAAPSAAAAAAAGDATARALAAALSIVPTGASLARLYSACRREAEALARARNEAFERSCKAFAANHLAQARSYSAQGQALDAQMRAAHRAAAAQIFAARNEGSSSSSSSSSAGGAVDVQVGPGAMARVRVWDLHGLHAAEAAPLVEEGLGGVPVGEWVALLTGARNHSSSLGKGGGNLGAALRAHLLALGWRVHDPMPGVLCVHVTAQ